MEEVEEGHLADVRQMSDIGEVRRLLQQLSAEELTIDEELEDLLQRRRILENKLSATRRLKPKLNAAQRDARQLAETVTDTCQVAQQISGRVRALDAAQERCRATLNKVSDIIGIKNCMESIEHALDGNDFEKAAKHIEWYSRFDPALLEESSTSQRLQLESRMKSVLRQRFDDAAQKGKHDDVMRFARLFAPVGLADEGLTRFSRYIKAQIAAEADAELKELVANMQAGAGGGGLTFTDVLTHLFESIAAFVENEVEVVEEAFGAGSMLALIQALQSQCDAQSTKIVNRFADVRRLEQTLRAISMASAKNGTSDATVDPMQLDVLLYEIAMMSQRTETYDAFIRRQAQAALDRNKAAESSIFVAPVVGLPHVSELNKRMQELMGTYVSIEQFFMEKSIHKAMDLDSLDAGDLTSSFVDDVFYILQKSLRRSLQTGSAIAVCAVLNHANNVLGGDVLNSLRGGLQEYAMKGTVAEQVQKVANLKQNASKAEKMTLSVVLNNIDEAARNLGKLRESLQGEAAHAFQNSTKHDQDKVAITVGNLSDTGEQFSQLLTNSLSDIHRAFSPKLKETMQVFLKVSYELSEEDFSRNELVNPFQAFISQLSPTLAPYKESLSTSNYDSFVQRVMQDVAGRIENDCRRKKFNQLGGLQFDKDVRAVVQFFTEDTQRTVRDKFTRLSQIATLLSVDQAAEAVEYTKSQSWRLAPAETRRYLRLRTDLPADSVAQLKL